MGENKIYVTVYVDDLLINGAESYIEMILAELRRKFKIKDLGTVKDLLGIGLVHAR